MSDGTKASDQTRRRRRWIAVAGCIVSLTGLVIALARLRIDGSPTAEAGASNLARLWPFWIASAAGWLALTGLWTTIERRVTRTDREPFLRIALLIVGLGVAARIAVVLTHTPALSDDIYRYVFDGRNLAGGINPYLVAPEERARPGSVSDSAEPGVIPVIDDARDAAERWTGESVIVELINNPELHTIYLPVSQLVFGLAGLAVPDGWSDPEAAARIFRGVFVLIELIAIGLLAVALRRTRRSAWWLALCVWHPLPITEIAGSGHQDIIGVTLLVAGLVIYTATPGRIARWIWALALAALVKPVVVPVAAVLLRGRSWLRWLAALAIAAAICAIVAAPLLLAQGGEPIENLTATAERFTLKWAHFGSVYEPLLAFIERLTPNWSNDPQEQLARKLCIGLLGLVVLGVFLRGRDAWADCAIIFLAMVLLSPTAHPWYLLWALVLVPIAPSIAVWTASLTLSWGYAAWADPETWSVPWPVMVGAYAPIYASLVVDVVRQWRGRGDRAAAT